MRSALLGDKPMRRGDVAREFDQATVEAHGRIDFDVVRTRRPELPLDPRQPKKKSVRAPSGAAGGAGFEAGAATSGASAGNAQGRCRLGATHSTYYAVATWLMRACRRAAQRVCQIKATEQVCPASFHPRRDSYDPSD